jgi:hypothetical protein
MNCLKRFAPRFADRSNSPSTRANYRKPHTSSQSTGRCLWCGNGGGSLGSVHYPLHPDPRLDRRSAGALVRFAPSGDSPSLQVGDSLVARTPRFAARCPRAARAGWVPAPETANTRSPPTSVANFLSFPGRARSFASAIEERKVTIARSTLTACVPARFHAGGSHESLSVHVPIELANL